MFQLERETPLKDYIGEKKILSQYFGYANPDLQVYLAGSPKQPGSRNPHAVYRIKVKNICVSKILELSTICTASTMAVRFLYPFCLRDRSK